MDPRMVLEWLEAGGWFVVDDRLRRAILARDALRRAGRNGHGTGTDDRPAATAENADSGGAAGSTPSHRTRGATHCE